MTTQYNYNVIRGDTFRQKIVVTKDGQPADITGWTIYFTIKKNKTDSDDNAVVKKDITNHIDPVNGESELLILPTETDNLLGVYYFDIQIKRHITSPVSYDDIATILEGTIKFSQDITRRVT